MTGADTAVSAYYTFPAIGWWMHAANMDTILLDKAEHFEKMTARNRYRISGANNSIMLSVPLVNGRNQHVPMGQVQIHNADRWQVQHWRTIVSVYRRSPYFEHYEPALQPLFQQPYTSLTDFNKAGMLWVKHQLNLKFTLQETFEYIKDYPTHITDLRHGHNITLQPRPYYQVFEDRTGFTPGLSILDLLFSEGPMSAVILKERYTS